MHKIVAVFLAMCVAVAVRAEVVAPQPFAATYAVSYRGIPAGSLHVELRREAGTNRYVYETRADPTLLARLIVSRDARERSLMAIDAGGVRPLDWKLEDGKRGKEDDGELHFDWERGRVTGEVEGEPVDLPTEPSLQDRMSIQIAVTTALLRGLEPGTIPLVDDERIKHYAYRRVDTEQLDTALGNTETVVYESSRPGSSRISRAWHAPAHQYIPVRAEQIRKGKLETVMVLTALERGDGGEAGAGSEMR